MLKQKCLEFEVVPAALLFVSILLVGCTRVEVEAIDRLANGPLEREMREKVAAKMPINQNQLIENFKTACRLYDDQPNDIKKSEIYRGTESFYRKMGAVKDWVGILRTISTDQGGSVATLMIDFGSSTVRDREVVLGSSVYKSAADLAENQLVLFSGRRLRDYNATERGKVCNPDFLIDLTSIKKID